MGRVDALNLVSKGKQKFKIREIGGVLGYGRVNRSIAMMIEKRRRLRSHEKGCVGLHSELDGGADLISKSYVK